MLCKARAGSWETSLTQSYTWHAWKNIAFQILNIPRYIQGMKEIADCNVKMFFLLEIWLLFAKNRRRGSRKYVTIHYGYVFRSQTTLTSALIINNVIILMQETKANTFIPFFLLSIQENIHGHLLSGRQFSYGNCIIFVIIQHCIAILLALAHSRLKIQ